MTDVVEVPGPATAPAGGDDPGSWSMSTMHRVTLAPGESLAELPGARWVLIMTGTVALETASRTQHIAAQGAALISGRTAHRIIAVESTELVVSDLRTGWASNRLPSPLIVAEFGRKHHGVVALITACPLTDACRPSLFAASYGGLIGASMASAWIDADDRREEPDQVVAGVLAAITDRPAEAWTVERMAQVAHLSRSALGERFRRALGRGPADVLRDVRMQAARRMLTTGTHSVEFVAHQAGYGSTAAFSRAFSAHHGMAPQVWRDQLLGTRRRANNPPDRTATTAPNSIAELTP